MKSCFAVLALLVAATVADAGGYGRSFVQAGPAGGVVIVNNNNNNAARREVVAQPTRAFRPFLRRLAPRAALNRDAAFGAPVDRFGRVRGAGAR